MSLYPYELLNGDYITGESLAFSSSNRAFRYGDGVFETICLRNKKPLFIDDHWNRLVNGLNVLSIPIPSGLSRLTFEKFITKLADKNNIDFGRMRFTVYREASGFFKPADIRSAWHCCITGSVNAEYNQNPTGLTASLFERDYKTRGVLSNIKTTNCLLYVIAGMSAAEKADHEVFICNDTGSVIETSDANIFLRKENTFTTPPLSEGCLDGIMRRQVIKFLQKHDLKLNENSISKMDLETADEILITNVIRGAGWIREFNGKEYENRYPELINLWLNNQHKR